MTLQPYFKAGDLRFVRPHVDLEHPTLTEKDYLRAMEHLQMEMKTFPLGLSDDILDAITDQFADRDWFGRTVLRPGAGHEDKERATLAAWAKYLGTEDPMEEE